MKKKKKLLIDQVLKIILFFYLILCVFYSLVLFQVEKLISIYFNSVYHVFLHGTNLKNIYFYLKNTWLNF
jgi:uncharacterized membrane protein (DUF106 family)